MRKRRAILFPKLKPDSHITVEALVVQWQNDGFVDPETGVRFPSWAPQQNKMRRSCKARSFSQNEDMQSSQRRNRKVPPLLFSRTLTIGVTSPNGNCQPYD